MATCRECLHFEVCDSGRHIGEYIEDDGIYSDGVEKECATFRNAADVAEVKHGEWIQEWELEKGLEDNSEFPYIKCSLCGHIEWGIEKELYETPNYCSECGAKMDGGKEE